MSEFSQAEPETVLNTGLAALRQQRYAEAVASLSKLQQNDSVPLRIRLKAQVGLAKAYGKLGQTEQAIALCQQLAQAPQSQVRTWAERLLNQLPPPPATDSTPTAASEPAPQSPSGSPSSTTHPSSEASADLTGFVPLSAEPANSAQTVHKPSEQPGRPPEATGSDTSQAQPPTNYTGASLFHYETLNRQESSMPSQETRAAPTPAPAAASPSPPATGGQGDRAATGPQVPPKQASRFSLALCQAMTAIALGLLLHGLIRGTFGLCLWTLQQLDKVLPIPRPYPAFLYQDHDLLMILILVGLLLSAPWWLDRLLAWSSRQRPLSIRQLKGQHPEGVRQLRQVCQQQGWLLPELRQIPTSMPLIFSYGWLPRNTRLVVSQGLLTQLDEAELAALYAYELAHLKTWTLPLMTLIGGLLQLLHQSYWQVARWGDRCSAKALRAIAIVISALCYGLYWLIRNVGIPLSRLRAHHGDEQSIAWTQRPNALTKALLKVARGTATTTVEREHTPPLLESLDILMPVGCQNSLTVGSLPQTAALSEMLSWDRQNPYRRWLSLNNTHPLWGERLEKLTNAALDNHLDPEIPLPPPATTVRLRGKDAFSDYWFPFLQQIAPFIGPLIGFAIAMGLWFLGGLIKPMDVARISWLYGDAPVIYCGILLGIGLGILLRINRYFPDIPSRSRTPSRISDLLKNPLALPTDSRPVHVQGKLLGRRGIANGLCQDFWLQTSGGLIKLHILSSLGPIGNLFLYPMHPTQLIGQSIAVSGWFRRGGTAWIDADQLYWNGRSPIRSHHPIWSTFLSVLFSLWGIYVLVSG